MLKDKLSLVILSCDKFSDLWDSHLQQLEKYWSDREIDTYIVTDKLTDKKYKNINFICCGDNEEYTERIKIALNQIKTEYILITLDDYFLIDNVNNNKIKYLINIMNQENIDYISMYKRSKRIIRDNFKNFNNIKNIDLNCDYSVTLYPAIWNRLFMLKTIETPLSPWIYEVSLHNIAKKYNAKCLISLNKEFRILDVVRKGKILHLAKLYFITHNMKVTDRPLCSLLYEIKLWVKTMASWYLPGKLREYAKNYMISKGEKFFTESEVNKKDNT